MSDARPSKVVVGVDGSLSSLAALYWASRQAELEGAELEAITAWDYPDHPTPLGIIPELPLPEDPLAEPIQRLAETVMTVLGRAHGLNIRTRVVQGSAAAILVEAARETHLLVVGSRGLGAIKGVLLGSSSA